MTTKTLNEKNWKKRVLSGKSRKKSHNDAQWQNQYTEEHYTNLSRKRGYLLGGP